MMSSSPNSSGTTDWDDEEIPRPDVSQLITEDDTPVDNQFSEKQMRLLTESIHASWRPGFPFVAMANVGVYVALNRPAIVPDVLVTTHVEPLQDLMHKEHRAYFSWMFDGKVPDVVIEIVSNTKGGELDSKLRNYQHMGVTWYAVFDPGHYLSKDILVTFALEHGKYRRQPDLALEELGLGLVLWEGVFEGVSSTWLRWRGRDGQMLQTGQERALEEANRAAEQAQRAAEQTQRATEEAQRADRLAAKLRELGVDPDSVT